MPCQFCLRPVRHTNLRRICGSCRRAGRHVCVFCGLPYTGDHTCPLNVPRCASCHEPYWVYRLALPIDAAKTEGAQRQHPGLCAKCRAKGFVLCHKTGCTTVTKESGKLTYCDAHHPLPASSLWRRGVLPTGGPPFVDVRSWRSWGVELECFFDRAARSLDGWSPPECWAKGTDGSIRPPYSTPSAEFRSPPYFGDKGLRRMMTDIRMIKRSGWSGVNKSCGMHVHIDMSGTDEEDHRAVFRFAKHHEDAIYELVAPSRRTNSYCNRLGARINVRDRYRWLNFVALREFGTVEVRLHQGSVDPIRAAMWVRLMLRFIETAIRQGRQRVIPDRPLFEALNLTAREKAYWTARRNRFVRTQQQRPAQAAGTGA